MASGDGVTRTSLIQRPTKRGQSDGSSTSTRRRSATDSPGLGRIRFREADRGAGDGRQLASQADHAQRVAAVRLDVHVQHDVAIQVGQGRPDARGGRQDQDAVAIAGQAQLVTRAEHPVADGAHLLGPLDPAIARQDGAGQRDRNPLADRDVGGAAHDLEGLAAADVDPGERQPVGARMTLDREQLAHDHVVPVGAPGLEGLDLHAEQGQALGQLLGGQLDVDVVAQPGQRDPHRNCSRKRRSLSRNSRRSVIPCLSILIRSGPIPKAKPW